MKLISRIDPQIPIIITGDFNQNLKTTPGFKTVLEKHDVTIVPIQTRGYTTKLVKNYRGEEFWNDEFDFVLFRGPVKPIGGLTSVTDATVMSNGLMPSFMFPSDHLAQGTVLKLLD